MEAQHLICDIYGCSGRSMWDRVDLLKWLDTLPHALGMRILNPAIVKRAMPGPPIDDGISGFVLINTSHISCHTWPDRKYVMFDACSCLPFDVDAILAELCLQFNTGDIVWQVLPRAERFRK